MRLVLMHSRTLHFSSFPCFHPLQHITEYHRSIFVTLTMNNKYKRARPIWIVWIISLQETFSGGWQGGKCNLEGFTIPIWRIEFYRAECDIRMGFDTNEYPNIFVSRKWHERISEYIRMIFFLTEQISEYIRINILIRTNIRIYSYPKNDTNEYPNKYSDQKYSNIRIYSSHSGLDWHQFIAFTI